MSWLSIPGRVVDTYRNEGGREVARRTWFRFKSGWISLLQRRHSHHQVLPVVNTSARPEPCSVDIIICVHNALDDIQRCLESLEQHTPKQARLLLVDDGSQSETADFLSTYAEHKNLRLIRNEQAKGYTFAANQGLRASSADQVVLLNSDTIVSEGWLEAMLGVLQSDSSIGIVGPLSNTASWQSIPAVEDAGDWKVNRVPSGLTLDQYAHALRLAYPQASAEVGFINGFCMLIRRTTLNDVGLFDEDTFGRGYGEENDFCLRAHKKGWKLHVAIGAYVFHAQSKSYSNERRQKLCQDADRHLDAKHGSALKHQRLGITMQHPLLVFARQASLDAEVLHQAHEHIAQQFADRRLLILLPAGHAGGGSNVVMQEARALQAAGVNVWLGNLPEHRANFQASYPDLEIPCSYFDCRDPDTLQWQARDFDTVIATHNASAHWAAKIHGKRLGYYIQDYEPFFYTADSKGYRTAQESYQLEAAFKRFCKTNWTQQTLLDQSGVSCSVIGPSVSSTQYAPGTHHEPSKQTNRPIIVAAMIRVSCERRQPRRTAEVLQQLKQRFGERVELVSFGSTDAELFAHGIPPALFANQGRLSPAGVAAVLKSADIFIDASTFQAMGLTAMEAMASGCAVVGPSLGGLPEITGRDGQSLALCVDTRSTATLVEACSQLIRNEEQRITLGRTSMQVCRYHPLLAAQRMMEVLFNEP